MKALGYLLVILVCSQANAGEFLEFKKWTDEKGVTHYSTVPREMLTNDMKLKTDYYIDRKRFADGDYLRQENVRRIERQQDKNAEKAQAEYAREQRRLSAKFAEKEKLKGEIYNKSKAIVDRGILGGEASYITSADARSNELRRDTMNDRAYERNIAEEGRVRFEAGKKDLLENRPDYAWHHGLQLQSLSYETGNRNLADQFYRQGAELMAAASKLLDEHRKVVNDYESGNTGSWQITVDK